MAHPFAELIGFRIEVQDAGHSRLSLQVDERHFNPHGVVHGAVLYALADTGMGAALYPCLSDGQRCATLEIKISYFKPVATGQLRCDTELVHRGRSVAHLSSRIWLEQTLVAVADGHFAISTARPG